MGEGGILKLLGQASPTIKQSPKVTTMLLTNNWTIVASVEGGEILAKSEDKKMFVSFPSNISSSEIEEILKDKEIDFNEWSADYHAGESENETVATWTI